MEDTIRVPVRVCKCVGLGHHQGVQAARLVHGAGHGGVAAPTVHLQLRGAAAPGTGPCG